MILSKLFGAIRIAQQNRFGAVGEAESLTLEHTIEYYVYSHFEVILCHCMTVSLLFPAMSIQRAHIELFGSVPAWLVLVKCGHPSTSPEGPADFSD